MKEALELYPALAESIWRVCSIRIAVPLLMSHPPYNSWTKEKVRLFCEKSSMATLPTDGQTIFQSLRDTVELILVQGKVTYAASRDSYEGPCILPKIEDRLVLHCDGVLPKILEIHGGLDGETGFGRIRNPVKENDITGMSLVERVILYIM